MREAKLPVQQSPRNSELEGDKKTRSEPRFLMPGFTCKKAMLKLAMPEKEEEAKTVTRGQSVCR